MKNVALCADTRDLPAYEGPRVYQASAQGVTGSDLASRLTDSYDKQADQNAASGHGVPYGAQQRHEGRGDMMRSVQRILAVLESFTPARNSLKLQEIADRIKLPKATTFRIVRSLELAGYLIRCEDQRYCLSFRITRLAGLVKSTLDIRTIARSVIVELGERTKETVAIHARVGRDRFCIDSYAGASSQLRSVLQPGEHLPLQLGSASKTLMAYIPANELAPIVASVARATKRKQAELYAALEQIRKCGYAVTHAERLAGLSAISAPIWAVDEQASHCLTVNGPTDRIKKQEKEFIKLVKNAAAEISRQYGGTTSHRSLDPIASDRSR
jgi:DNA-binding IclR family transcriptional regulator